MKKTLLTLSTAALTMSTMAATVTSPSQANVSVTATPTTIFANMIKDTSASIGAGSEANNKGNNKVGSYMDLYLSKKFSETVSTTLAIRSEVNISDDASEETAYKMIDPRLFINAFNTEIATSVGNLTIAPALRIQAHTQGDNKGKLATLRLGATASLETAKANTTSLTAHAYDQVTDDDTSDTSSALYFILDDTYAINDGNALSLTFEHFFTTETTANLVNAVRSDNDLTLTYANSMIKDFRIAPYLSQELNNGVKTASSEFLELGVDVSYNF